MPGLYYVNAASNGKLHLSIPCSVCHRIFDLLVPEQAFRKWLSGAGLIQDMLPGIPEHLRELFISNTCQFCWESLFRDQSEAPEREIGGVQ